MVMLNLFQHLTASLYLPPFLGEILKQVQDDVIVSNEWWALSDELWAMSSERKYVWKTGTWIAGGFQALGFIVFTYLMASVKTRIGNVGLSSHIRSTLIVNH